MNKKKNSTLYPHSWYKSLSKIPKEAAADIYLALHKLDITGEMTFFEEGSIQDILFSQFAETVLSNREAYEEECRNRSEAAKAREAKKAQASTKKHEQAQRDPDKRRCDVSGVDKNRCDVSGGDVSGVDASAPSADTTTTTLPEADIERRIMDAWNDHDFTQNVMKISRPDKRWDRTEIAIAIAGGPDAFVDLIRSLNEQAYFRTRKDKGYKVDYDWFVDPDNFQGVVEGRYRADRNAVPEGYEVVRYDEIRS